MTSAGLSNFERYFLTERIGSPNEEKDRPLMVEFDYKTATFGLLAKSKKNNEDYVMVFIAPDRRRDQREKHRKLVQQLKQKRAENSYKN